MDQQQLDAIRERLESYEAKWATLEWHKLRYGLRGSVGRKLESQAFLAWEACTIVNGPETQRALLNAIDELQAENAQLRAGMDNLKQERIEKAKTMSDTIRAINEADNKRRAEVEQCFALLEELTMQCISYDDYGAECIHCKSEMYSSGRCDHHLDCPIVVANKLLEGKE